MVAVLTTSGTSFVNKSPNRLELCCLSHCRRRFATSILGSLSFPPFVVEIGTLVGPDHVTTLKLGGKKNWMTERGYRVKKLLL